MSGGSDDRRLVLMTLGTDHHAFDRAVTWMEDWLTHSNEDVHVVVQHGSSRVPVGAEAHDRIPMTALSDLMSQADVVITHAGGGSITQCWQVGKAPIVLVRQRRLNEHVDDHQRAFAQALTARGYPVRVTLSYEEFSRAVDDGLRHATRHFTSGDSLTAVRAVAAVVEEVTLSRPGRRSTRAPR
jgi:UDP-N-acetylglucosamine transferase subunit ALG13